MRVNKNREQAEREWMHPDHRVTHQSEASVPAVVSSGPQPEEADANNETEKERGIGGGEEEQFVLNVWEYKKTSETKPTVEAFHKEKGISRIFFVFAN